MAVNLSPYGGVGAQFLDNSGNVLTGGKIFTYAGGTTTPQATYTSSNGVTPHPNPIILDAAGRVPGGEIWLTDGLVYKFILRDANDVLIATYDGITGINSNFVAFTNQQEIQTATAGQTVFNLTTMSYQPGTNSLSVFVDGVNQYGPGAQYAYLETDSDTVTFLSGLHVGAEVKFTTSQLNSSVSTTNAFQVSYTPPFTGSVATNVGDKLAETVSVTDFGAVGDGIVDDTVAIQAALASLETTGGELHFPPGTYKVTAPIAQEFNDGVNVKITGYGAKIDGTSVTGGTNGDTVLILLGGSTDSVFTKTFPNSALGANVVKNATSITSAGTFGVQPNDILLITSTDLWNPTRIYYFKGEMVEVRGVSGTTIDCSNGLFDGYTAATTTIYRLTMPYVSVEGLEIEMNANQIGLAIHYSRNATVRNVTVHGARYSGIQTFYCFGGLVDNCFVYDAWASGSDSYGVTVASNQNFSVTNCTLTQARHCITSGGFEPNRLLNYSNNHCTAHPLQLQPYAIDVHGNAEYVIIANNYSEGIVCSGINASILGNIATANKANSQAINIFQEINSVYYNISDNYIETKDALAQGIWISPLEDNLTINRLTILGNTVISVGTGILIQPRNNTVTGSTILSCFVTGNIVVSDLGSAFIIQHGVGSDQTVKRLSTANNNFSTNTGGVAFLIIATASIDMHTSTGDSYIAGLNSNLSTPCVFSGTDIKISNAYFDGFLPGGGGLGGRINYNNTGYIQVNNCTFKNLTWRASLLSASSTYIENGAIDETFSKVIVNTVNAKIITSYDSAGNAIASRTAAPTINTWGVGDIVWNSTPVVGQPKGWMCTVAGTPGTWVSMGNL